MRWRRVRLAQGAEWYTHSGPPHHPLGLTSLRGQGVSHLPRPTSVDLPVTPTTNEIENSHRDGNFTQFGLLVRERNHTTFTRFLGTVSGGHCATCRTTHRWAHRGSGYLPFSLLLSFVPLLLPAFKRPTTQYSTSPLRARPTPSAHSKTGFNSAGTKMYPKPELHAETRIVISPIAGTCHHHGGVHWWRFDRALSVRRSTPPQLPPLWACSATDRRQW